MSLEYVFVYGTLRRGASNDFRMDGARFLGRGTVRGRMYRVSWYPAVIVGGEERVHGEVYEVDERHLVALDRFEGIGPEASEPMEYERVRVMVQMEGGGQKEVWIWNWIGVGQDKSAIPGGDWIEAERNQG